MLTGHFAIGFAGKRAEPKLSLGTLVLACLLCDLLWCAFMIAGIEQVRIKPGVTIAPGVRVFDALEVIEIGYSHSLLATAVWGALFALLHFSRRRNQRAACVLFAVVLSHWVLDVIAHPPDMPLIPGGSARLGLGLWTSIPATLIIEGAAWAIALFAYVRMSPANSRTARYAFWIVVVVLTAAWIGNIAGPPPADPSAIGYSSGSFFLLAVAWAYWMNRLRSGQIRTAR